MTPTEEVSQAFAAAYSSNDLHAGASANGSVVSAHASGAGALHRNISQGQVRGATLFSFTWSILVRKPSWSTLLVHHLMKAVRDGLHFNFFGL